jgi:hypothetical protein
MTAITYTLANKNKRVSVLNMQLQMAYLGYGFISSNSMYFRASLGEKITNSTQIQIKSEIK